VAAQVSETDLGLDLVMDPVLGPVLDLGMDPV
jgi:hypothetical protein